MNVLAVDPGTATGWALLRNNTLESGVWLGGVAPAATAIDEIASAEKVQIVIEQFIPRPNVKFVPDSLHIIGCVLWIADAKKLPPVVFQTPTEAKRACDDKKIRSLGIWNSKNGGHANDAIRHIWLYLYRNKELHRLGAA